MKRLLIVVMMLGVSFSFAQESKVESTFEQEGNLVAVTTYYEDGSVKEKGFYKDKKLHGEWTKFDENGVKVVRAFYENGKKTGKWMFLNDGVLTEVDYVDNRIASTYTWNKENSVVIY